MAEVTLAGSNQVAHIVDCVLVLESDKNSPIKYLRTYKNRFGPTDEIGLFAHTERGLKAVEDPSGMLMDEGAESLSGSACTLVSEGLRQIPVEIQALAVKSTLANPRRQFSGINFQRGQIVVAICDKFLNAKLWENDVFVSTVAGISSNDPQLDMALAVAIMSSLKNKVSSKRTMYIGELGLTGQVRGSFLIDGKIKEAIRLGFERVVVPASSRKAVTVKSSSNFEIIYVSKVSDLLRII